MGDIDENIVSGTGGAKKAILRQDGTPYRGQQDQYQVSSRSNQGVGQS